MACTQNARTRTRSSNKLRDFAFAYRLRYRKDSYQIDNLLNFFLNLTISSLHTLSFDSTSSFRSHLNLLNGLPTLPFFACSLSRYFSSTCGASLTPLAISSSLIS